HRAVLVEAGRALLQAQSAALIDPQAILAKLRQVGTLPMRAKTNAADPTAEFDPLHTVLVFDGTGACDQRDVPSAVARDRRQPELAVQQEIAAMETYVVAMLHQGCAVLSVVAENGTEDVER